MQKTLFFLISLIFIGPQSFGTIPCGVFVSEPNLDKYVNQVRTDLTNPAPGPWVSLIDLSNYVDRRFRGLKTRLSSAQPGTWTLAHFNVGNSVLRGELISTGNATPESLRQDTVVYKQIAPQVIELGRLLEQMFIKSLPSENIFLSDVRLSRENNKQIRTSKRHLDNDKDEYIVVTITLYSLSLTVNEIRQGILTPVELPIGGTRYEALLSEQAAPSKTAFINTAVNRARHFQQSDRSAVHWTPYGHTDRVTLIFTFDGNPEGN